MFKIVVTNYISDNVYYSYRHKCQRWRFEGGGASNVVGTLALGIRTVFHFKFLSLRGFEITQLDLHAVNWCCEATKTTEWL